MKQGGFNIEVQLYKEVYRQAAVVSEPLERPGKRSTDEALRAAHQ